MVLIAADVVLGLSGHWGVVIAGVALGGVHMGITQGLLATMVTDTAPADLRGTAYGMFNLVSGLAMLVASALPGCYGTSWARLPPFTQVRCFADWRWVCWPCIKPLRASTDAPPDSPTLLARHFTQQVRLRVGVDLHPQWQMV